MLLARNPQELHKKAQEITPRVTADHVVQRHVAIMSSLAAQFMRVAASLYVPRCIHVCILAYVSTHLHALLLNACMCACLPGPSIGAHSISVQSKVHVVP